MQAPPSTVKDKPVGTLVIVMMGGNVKVLSVLLLTPFTVTTTLPVVAPVGTTTVILVEVQLVGLAAVPLNLTEPIVAPKFAPVIVTGVPTGPEMGDSEVMFGVDGEVMLIVTGVTWERGPLVATTGMVLEVPGCPVPVVIVMTVEPDPVTVLGLNVTAPPGGANPEGTEKVTTPVKPFIGVTEIIDVALLPGGADTELGDGVTVKSCCGTAEMKARNVVPAVPAIA